MHVFLSLRVSRGFRFFCSPTRDALRVGQTDRYPVVLPSPYLQRDAWFKIEFKAKLAPLVRLSPSTPHGLESLWGRCLGEARAWPPERAENPPAADPGSRHPVFPAQAA